MLNITIVKLSGGIGNQMFQYYAAHNLSKLNNSRLYIDTSNLYIKSELITYREFELNCFKIKFKSINRFFLLLIEGYARVFSKRISSTANYNKTLTSKAKGVYVLDHHFIDIDVKEYEFKRLFKWDKSKMSKDLINSYNALVNLEETVGVFLRKDDWIKHDPNNVVSDKIFENELNKMIKDISKSYNLVLFQIGKEEISFSKEIIFKFKFIDDCNKCWNSYEKMFLLSAMKNIITPPSSYGKASLLLANLNSFKIIDINEL